MFHNNKNGNFVKSAIMVHIEIVFAGEWCHHKVAVNKL